MRTTPSVFFLSPPPPPSWLWGFSSEAIESAERGRREVERELRRRGGLDLCRLVPSIYCFSVLETWELWIGNRVLLVSSLVSPSFSSSPSSPILHSGRRGGIRCNMQGLVLE